MFDFYTILRINVNIFKWFRIKLDYVGFSTLIVFKKGKHIFNLIYINFYTMPFLSKSLFVFCTIY